MADSQKGSKILRGINYSLSGENEVIIAQKNGVLRVKKYPSSKRKKKLG